MIYSNAISVTRLAVLALAAAALSGCVSSAPPMCEMPHQHRLDDAIAHTQAQLLDGCEGNFYAYMDALLGIAEGDPGPENKQQFSEFLVWVSERGILSRRQARELYNRYFNVKFVSLLGDYNNCAYTCPRQDDVMSRMEAELGDKERGLLKVSLDRTAYYRADKLFKETELVLAATCEACANGRSAAR